MPTDYGTNNIIADGSAMLYINNTQIPTLDFRVEDGAVGYLSELDYEPITASTHDLQQEFMNIQNYYPSDKYYSPAHVSDILRKLIKDVEMCKSKCGINIESDDEISDDNQALDQFLGEFMQQGGDINKGSL